ncbi:MAG: ATP phosphoribosyltransferase regulatory subunit [Verrucomicrobiae bacterium]|nr:ATP phosphoribosyltransferase regulatory subunit [Verrucomicrobiae bacterium]
MDRLPGFRDFYPEPLPNNDVWSADIRNHVFDTWRSVARSYGFSEYDGPPLEPTELFTKKSGDEIVGQLYNFTDKGEREISLRPEMTPTLARMAAAAERNYKKPFKWFSIPQLFRYERQQKGRLREHYQLNCDIIGEDSPAADAELIALLIDCLRALDLSAEDFVVRLSSRNAWQDFFDARCNDPAKAYEFYQIIDKLEREDPAVSDEKLAGLGFSGTEIREFIAAGEPTAELKLIVDDLAARGLRDFVKIDYGVIRGLAYYSGPVFEAFDRKGEFRAIAGGGRYNQLIRLISDDKVDLPALGFGMGDVVLTELLKARGLLPELESDIDVFFLIEDEALRPRSLRQIQKLREDGYNVEFSLTPMKGNKQFKRAQELGVEFTIRLEGEMAVVKSLKTRDEARLAPEELTDYLVDTIVDRIDEQNV